MFKTIVKVTCIAGLLDIIAAFVSSYFTNGIGPGRVLQYVASGVFGIKSFAGGYVMMAWGLLFHFLITFACTIAFFFIYPHLGFLRRRRWLNTVLLGVIAWLVTNLLILPVSNTPPVPMTTVSIIRSLLILIFCLGLPISLLAIRYYEKPALDHS